MLFFRSGVSWLHTFSLESTDNDCYWKIAHQMIAARLNVLSGASMPAIVDSAMSVLTAALLEHDRTFIDGGSRCANIYVPRHDILNTFNTGMYGVPTC